MTESSATQGTVMMVVAVITVLVTSEPLPVTVAIIGIGFLGVGARKRRSATRL